MTREDLLCLDEDKLAELATRGHVKKAAKDLAAGRGPTIVVESDSTVVATSADATVRLSPGQALRDTHCTCPAPRVCRHRVMAVLAYRGTHAADAAGAGEPWNPATFDDDALRAHIGAGAWRRAKKRAAQGCVATLHLGAVPSASLPACTVRFLVRGHLDYARCDCAQGPTCEHLVLAVWAFRDVGARLTESRTATVEVGGTRAIELGALKAANELARELLLDGAVGSDAGLAGRFARAIKPLGEASLLWPRLICEELRQTLEGYSSRSATYGPRRLGDLLTELHARSRAAARDGAVPARAILGLDEPEETALEHLRLVSLGCRLTRVKVEEEGYRMLASVWLANPAGGDVLVLERHWEVGADEVGAALARRHVRPSIPLGTLAHGQMVSRGAKRRANQVLVLSGDRRGMARTSVTPQRGAWDLLGPPHYVEDFSALDRDLRDAAPRFVRRRLRTDRIRVLRIASIGEPRYDPATQTLEAPVADASGARVWITCTHSAAAPSALDALRDCLRTGARFVSGEVWREAEVVRIRPLSVVTDRVRTLDLEPPPSAPSPRATSGAAEAPCDGLHARLTEARAHLDRGAHAGLRHVSHAWREALDEHRGALEGAGLVGCAERAQSLCRALASAQLGAESDDSALAPAWLDASLRIRLALELG